MASCILQDCVAPDFKRDLGAIGQRAEHPEITPIKKQQVFAAWRGKVNQIIPCSGLPRVARASDLPDNLGILFQRRRVARLHASIDDERAVATPMPGCQKGFNAMDIRGLDYYG